MMKSKFYCSLVMFFILVLNVQAQQWDEDLRELGLSFMQSEILTDGTVRGELRSAAGIPITFILGPERSEWKSDLQKILTPIENFEFIQVQRIQIILDSRRSEAIFLPSRFTYPQAISITGNIPSGIYFYLNKDGQLFYSLRMLVDDYVLRVVGQYLNEEVLLRRLIIAKADPVQFLRSQDPEFILELLERIENRLISLEDTVLVMKEAIYAKGGGLDNLEERITGLDAITGELGDTLTQTREVLSDTDTRLETRLDTFLSGSIPLFSKGLGNPKPVDEQIVRTVSQTIRENPRLTNTEIRNKLRDEKGIKISKKLIYTVRSVYFGQPDS